MRQHRMIWTITLLVALAALGTAAVRHRIAWKRAERDMIEARLAHMYDLLERDPRARRAQTQSAVNAVADLVDDGRLHSAQGYFAVALREHGLQHLETAEDAARRAIALEPDWSWPYHTLGLILHAQRSQREAIEVTEQAIELDPGWSRAHNTLAVFLRMLGQYDAALEAAETALALDPADVAAHNNYGNLLVALRRYDEARQAYLRAMRLEPRNAAPYYNLACLASITGDRETALEFLTSALELEPGFRNEALRDANLDAIRDDPRFTALIGVE